MRKAIVLGTNDRASLEVTRSLGRAGINVTLVSFGPDDPVHRSKYVQQYHNWGWIQADYSGWCERLVDLATREAGSVLIPINDLANEVVYANHSRLRANVVIAGPTPASYELAKSKFQMLRLYEELGGPSLPTHHVTQLQQLDQIDLDKPVYAKPVSSTLIIDSVIHTSSVRRIRDREGLINFARDYLGYTSITVQQACEGTGVGVNLLASEGEILAIGVNERLHEPPNGGASSYRRSIELPSELGPIIKTMVSRLRWSGVMMIELRRSGDAYYFMEINSRFWGSLSLSVWAGIDYPLLLFQLFTDGPGDPLDDGPYEVGRYARHLKRDLKWVKGTWNRRRADLTVPIRWLLSFRRVFTGREAWDVERWWDLGPAMNQLCRKTRGARRHSVYKSQPSLISAGQNHLFVCKGNINRSPIAERIALSLGHRARSCGTLKRAGRWMSSHAEAWCKRVLGSESPHTSMYLTEGLINWADIVWVFDRGQLDHVAAHFPQHKAKMLLVGNVVKPGMEVPDPYGGPAETYERTFNLIRESVDMSLSDVRRA